MLFHNWGPAMEKHDHRSVSVMTGAHEADTEASDQLINI